MNTDIEKTPDSARTIVVAVEGLREWLELSVMQNVPVADVISEVEKRTGIGRLTDLYIEGHNNPLEAAASLASQLPVDFVVLHAASKGAIEVGVHFNNREVKREFLPSATLRTVTAWAISPDGLNLSGVASDFQLKLNGVTLEPDLHLGQVTGGQKKVEFDLVMKVKAQG